MSTSIKHILSPSAKDQKYIKDTEMAIDTPVTEPAEPSLPSPALSPGVEILTKDEIQKPRTNAIIMKKSREEDIEMSLDFGLMRDGAPYTDDEDSEQESEADIAIKKKIILGTRFSQIMRSNFLSKRVPISTEQEVKLEMAATQTKKRAAPKRSQTDEKAAAPKRPRRRRRRHGW